MDLYLSIIVPVYNAQHFIADCLSSLIDQNVPFDRYEIIVIDDGSKDESLRIIRDFASKYSNIRIIQQENRGAGAARNVGILNARGAYLYFLDADDYVARQTLGIAINDAMRLNLDLLCFRSLNTKDRKLLVSQNLKNYRLEPSISNGRVFIESHSLRNSICCLMVRKQLILSKELYFPEGCFYEDVIFALKVLIASERVTAANLDVHRYYQTNPASITHNMDAAHYSKTIKDLEQLVVRMDEVIGGLNYHEKCGKCAEKIKQRKNQFVFLLIARRIRSSEQLSVLRHCVHELKKSGNYPLTNFPGDQGHEFYVRYAVFVINKPFLLFTLAYIVKMLKIGKYLHR